MNNIKLYIWDNAIIVAASSIEEARNLAIERLAEINAAKEMVRQEQPLELEAPCVHLIFHAGVIS